MKKILYIQIDNSLIEQNNDIVILDCRCNVDFCSFVGYELVDGLSNSDGIPYYRLVNHPANLLIDFAKYDNESFLQIINQWYSILGNILQNGNKTNHYFISFPEKYVDWLRCNENNFYSVVGEKLLEKNNCIKVEEKELCDDIVSAIWDKIHSYILSNSDDLKFVTFSNKIIDNNCYSNYVLDDIPLKTVKEFESFIAFRIKPFFPQYYEVKSYSEGMAAVKSKRNNRWGYINSEGIEVVACKYVSALDFHDGMACVKKNDRWGAIDKSGYERIPCIYFDCNGWFRNGANAFKLKKDTYWQYKDKSGNNIGAYFIKTAWGFYDGIAIIEESDGCYAGMDNQGKILFRAKSKIDIFGNFFNGFAEYKEWVGEHGIDWLSGVIDRSGNIIIPCIYEEIGSFNERLARVKKNGKWGYINENGTTVVSHKYDDCHAFFDNIAAVKTDGRWGFIDREGKIVISCQFEDVSHYSSGLAAVKKDGKWGFVDKKGNCVIPFRYDQPKYDDYYFKEGYAALVKDGKWGYVDMEGNEVVPFIYDYAAHFNEGMACIKKDENWGFLNRRWLI